MDSVTNKTQLAEKRYRDKRKKDTEVTKIKKADKITKEKRI